MTAQGGTPGPNHHAFALGYRSTDVDLRKCHPLAAHSAYLWSVYQERIEPMLKLVHVPTMERVFQELRRSVNNLPSGMEALVFAIYFGAVTSLLDVDVRYRCMCREESSS